MKKTLLLVALATLFFSCQKEMEPAANESNESKSIAFVASIEQPKSDTKADINASNQLVWADDDKIGIFVPDWDDKNQPFTVPEGEGGSTSGSFSWDYGDFTHTTANAAFFPWGGDNHIDSSNGKFYLELPEHNGTDAEPTYTSGKMLTPLVAQVTRTGDAYDVINFKHAGAAVKVTINNLPVGSHSISLTADHPIYGYYNIDPANYEDGMVENSAGVNDGNTTSFLHFAPSSEVRPFTFLFPVPSLPASSALTFNIYDKNNVRVWGAGAKTKDDVALGRADVLTMPALSITTPYKDFDQISAWGVCGSHTGWASDTPMVTEVDGNIHIANDITFEANAEFKIRKDGDWSKGEYNWSNIDGTDGLENSSGNIKVLNAGTYDVILNTSTHKIKVVASDIAYPNAAGMPHHTSIKKAKNLGKEETANCYVITAAGNYKLPAAKGNSNESAGTVTGVELLWETYNNETSVTPNSVIAAVDYDETDNFVYFKTPAVLQPGNALIAAKNGDDIIWSWHIWIPQTTIESSTYGKIFNHELMDRNLGALVAATTSSVPAESYGLHYQWGRKDPFVGAAATSGSTNASISGTALSLSAEALTLDQAIQNPTVLGPATDWLDATNNNLWKNNEKTQYDPCPAGYKVPGYDSGQPLCSSDYSGVTGWSDSAEGRYFTLGSPVAVFPYTGYREEGGTTAYKNGTRAAIWFAYSNSSSGYAYHMNVRNADTHQAGNTAKARGCTVRCVKIEEAPVFDPTEKGSAVDKSASESANCYVITAESANASKIFKFKTVKGNSNETLDSPASASVIWETWNNGETVTAGSVIDAVEYYNNYVYFRMPASPHAGNALIAVKNSSGTILWSWHIWVPSTSVSSIDNGIHTTAMMDRNLGALSVAVASADTKIDVTTMGMWYQWGRKDPFPGPSNIDTEGSYPGFASVSGTAPSAQKVQLSLEQSIQQPTVFARGKYVDDALSVEDWLSTPDGTLWGDGTTKSKYDPCPVGYRVPNRDKNKPLWKADMTNETGWSYNSTKYWFTLGSPASVFPCAGFCNGGSAKVTFRTVIWNAHHDSSDKADTAYNIYVYLSSGNPAFANYGHGKARGNYVRCCLVE